MNKSKLMFAGLMVTLLLPLQLQAQTNPNCQVNVEGKLKRVHVWYSFTNLDAKYPWFMQISTIFENNLGFVDENCQFLNTSQKLEISPNSVKKVGMVVLEDKSFQSMYSFLGVRNDEALWKVPNRKMACLFVVAPYGPGQMDRVDWKFNNADCSATDYGTKIYFR